MERQREGGLKGRIERKGEIKGRIDRDGRRVGGIERGKDGERESRDGEGVFLRVELCGAAAERQRISGGVTECWSGGGGMGRGGGGGGQVAGGPLRRS